MSIPGTDGNEHDINERTEEMVTTKTEVLEAQAKQIRSNPNNWNAEGRAHLDPLAEQAASDLMAQARLLADQERHV